MSPSLAQVAEETREVISSDGAARRIRALMRIGHLPLTIARDLPGGSDATVDLVWHLAVGAGPAEISETLHQRVVRTFQRLTVTVPQGAPHDRMRTFAEALSWPTVVQWNDIDTDPEPEPEGTTTQHLAAVSNRREDVTARLAEAEGTARRLLEADSEAQRIARLRDLEIDRLTKETKRLATTLDVVKRERDHAAAARAEVEQLHLAAVGATDEVDPVDRIPAPFALPVPAALVALPPDGPQIGTVDVPAGLLAIDHGEHHLRFRPDASTRRITMGDLVIELDGGAS